jgi:hypothetical protein
VICLGFVRTTLIEKQIPEQARELGISEQDVVMTVMLKQTVLRQVRATTPAGCRQGGFLLPLKGQGYGG